MLFGFATVGTTALALAAGAGAAEPLPSVAWKSGASAPDFKPGALAEIVSQGKHFVVELRSPPTAAAREDLENAGLRLLAPLGANCFFAAPVASALIAAPDAGVIQGAAPIRTDWKLHRSLLDGETPDWTIVTAGEDPEVAVYVTLHEDVPAGAAAAVVGPHGGRVISLLSSVNAAVVHAPRSAMMAIAAEDEVQWVEPALPLLTEANAENRALTGVNTLFAAPYSLTGAGVSVFVFDAGGVRWTHVDLQGRVTQVDAAAWNAHATHVAGTVGGGGIANPNHRGMAPGATLLAAGFNMSVEGWLYTNPSDIEADYTAAYAQGADIATNSLSTNVSQNNPFPCTWEGDYGATDAVLDAIVRGDSPVTGNAPFRMVWAAGNERTDPRCGATYNTIPPPSGAKNHLSIGSVDSNNDLVSSFSSWGPTDDGRMKPDFCAPGCQLGGDSGVTSCGYTSNTVYTSRCGTSMATPTVAGCAALVLQDWRALFPGAPDPRNSMLKVLFAHSAVDRGNPGPDYQYGYGSIRVHAAVDLMRTARLREAAVSQGRDSNYTVEVGAGEPEFAVTLAWDDPPATPNVIPALINDVDLEVYSPSGTREYPWTLDPGVPSANAARTQPNRRDNLEQVRIAAPAPGVWRIRVRAFSVPVGPQPFSLVASHTLHDSPACSADFDGDGDTGTDADIEAFFACLGGNCCPTCGSADFDSDGDTGTDADIEAFFRVLGGGSC